MPRYKPVEYSVDGGKKWLPWYFAQGGKAAVRQEILDQLPELKARLNKGKRVNFVENIEVRVEGQPILNGKSRATKYLNATHAHLIRAVKSLERASGKRELRKEDYRLISEHLAKATYMVARLQKKEG